MNNVNRIFCAFPIFAPSKDMFEKNMVSVVSFVEYLKVNPFYLDGSKGYILDIYYGGWSAKDEYFEELKKFIKENIPNAKVFPFDKNYGKAKVVNMLFEEYSIENPNTQFVFSIDSDMKFQIDQLFFFDRLVLAANSIQEALKKPFGLIALNQSESNYHWMEPRTGYTGMNQNISYTLNGNGMNLAEQLVWPSDGCGIAGGGLFLNAILFKTIGGYRQLNSPYNGDDGYLLRDMIQIGASAAIIKTLFLTHPNQTDTKEYLQHKEECMKTAFEPFDKNKYDEFLDKSEKIWE